jgi:hypothetical protein
MNRVERQDEIVALFDLWEQYQSKIDELTMSALLFRRKVGASAVVKYVFISPILGSPSSSLRYPSQMGFQQQVSIPSGVKWHSWPKGLFSFSRYSTSAKPDRRKTPRGPLMNRHGIFYVFFSDNIHVLFNYIECRTLAGKIRH